MKHPFDPPATYAAIPRFAPLIARDLLTVAECVPVLVDHAIQRGYQGDRGGIQARIAHALADQSAAVSRDRDRSASFIERDAWEAMDNLVPSPVILAAASRTNTKLGAPLDPTEVRAIVADIAARWLKRRRYRHG